jgi:pimeloyl-ACP methyl ester carboxylesterase
MWKMLRFSCFLAAWPAAHATTSDADTVVLLHGLGRGPASMWPLARSLEREGYRVVNVCYPSQRADIATLAEGALGPVFAAETAGRIHLVTHSLGGILVRRYLKDHGTPAALGRVVMLAPPNAGSEIVDTLAGWRVYAWVNGPAGLDLGTAAHHAPVALGAPPPGVEIGVIAGDRSWNPLFSALIPGADDGKVAVARTHLAGEADHVTLPYSHTWLMNRRETRRQVAAFLRDGRFAQP